MARPRHAHSLFIAAALAAAASAPLTAQADDSWELTLDVINLLDAGSDGAMFGFSVKEVHGPALTSYNTSGLFGRFYPASTIKVLHHLTAMRWVAQQQDISELYNTDITVYEYSCSGTGDTWTEPLDQVLQAMMVNSDNKRTNAIQDHFTQGLINQTAHNVVGMSWETELNHKFGCGGPTNDPANRMTIADLTLLYERYVKGELLDAAYMDAFEDLMLSEDVSTFWDGLINTEAASLGLTQTQEDDFRADLRFAHKAGNWSTTHESRGGFVELPNRTCKGVAPIQYAYGVFVDDADTMTAGITSTATREMMRGQFRNAMRTFKPQALLSCIQGIQTLTPDAGGNTTLSAATGYVTIDIPSDSTFNRVLRMESASLASVDNVPAGLVDIGHGFWFTLVEDGGEVAYPYLDDAELSLSYSDAAVSGLDEGSLALYRWDDAGGWQPVSAACPGATTTHDTRGNQLHVNVCATGKYALFVSPFPT